jgi:hypothetical protein
MRFVRDGGAVLLRLDDGFEVVVVELRAGQVVAHGAVADVEDAAQVGANVV